MKYGCLQSYRSMILMVDGFKFPMDIMEYDWMTEKTILFANPQCLSNAYVICNLVIVPKYGQESSVVGLAQIVLIKSIFDEKMIAFTHCFCE